MTPYPVLQLESERELSDDAEAYSAFTKQIITDNNTARKVPSTPCHYCYHQRKTGSGLVQLTPTRFPSYAQDNCSLAHANRRLNAPTPHWSYLVVGAQSPVSGSYLKPYHNSQS